MFWRQVISGEVITAKRNLADQSRQMAKAKQYLQMSREELLLNINGKEVRKKTGCNN